MDGSSAAVGAGTTIEFGGETLILDPLTISDFGIVENHLLQSRPNPINLAAEAVERLHERAAEKAEAIIAEAQQRSAGLTSDAAQAVLAEANRKAGSAIQRAEQLGRDMMDRAFDEAKKVAKIDIKEVQHWMDTPPGVAYTIWLSLEKRYPSKFTLKEANKIIDAMSDRGRAELVKSRDLAAGTHVLKLKNSTSSPDLGEVERNTTSSPISEKSPAANESEAVSTGTNSSSV